MMARLAAEALIGAAGGAAGEARAEGAPPRRARNVRTAAGEGRAEGTVCIREDETVAVAIPPGVTRAPRMGEDER